jgi:hypothetical protein
MKPMLRIVTPPPPENAFETAVDVARKRAGGAFGYERKDFEWKSGPTVLTQWLAERTVKK